MALISCPECKKEISDTIKACPHCGYNLVVADLHLPKSMTPEITYFRNDRVQITNSRFIVGSQTYVMPNVTSVKGVASHRSKLIPISLCIGCLVILVSFALDDRSPERLPCLFAAGMAILGGVSFLFLKTPQVVILTTPSGEIRAYESRDPLEIRQILDAANKALTSCSKCKKALASTRIPCPHCGYDLMADLPKIAANPKEQVPQSKQSVSPSPTEETVGRTMTNDTKPKIPLSAHVFACTVIAILLGLAGWGVVHVWNRNKSLRLPGPEEKLIPYEVLKQKQISHEDTPDLRDKFDLEIMVSEKASKEEVMKLAEWFRENNQDRLLLSIFDSREVYEYLTPGETISQSEWNRKYGTNERPNPMEKECKLHWLAGIGPSGKVGWWAKGRDH